MNDLAAALGGAAPAAPLPPVPGQSPDPLAAALAGGAPAPMDPAMGGMPMASPFPTTDPNAVGSILEQLLMAQQQDQGQLQQMQQQALLGNPLFQALVGGAPLGPGAGQDAQGIGPAGDIAPAADPGMGGGAY